MIKAVIFDFDGVLVESIDIKTEAFAKLFKNEAKITVNEILNYHLDNLGVSRYDKFKYIYKNILKKDLSENEFKNLCSSFSLLVVGQVKTALYVKGALAFLENFSQKYSCFVSSATPQKEIEEIINARGIAGYFKGIYGSPDSKEDIVRTIVNNNGFAAQDIVYVGDAYSDYEAAQANSVTFIARLNDNRRIFSKTHCLKTRNLTNLENLINKCSRTNSNIEFKVILVHGSLSLASISRKFPKTPWIFLDPGFINRVKWEAALGVEFKVNFKDKLDEVSLALRDDFVEWTTVLGKSHWHKWFWWISRLATRNNLDSKLYLHFCYAQAVKFLLKEEKGSFLVISNSWELLEVIEKYYKRKALIIKPGFLKITIARLYDFLKDGIMFIFAWVLFFKKSFAEFIASRLTRIEGYPQKRQINDNNHFIIHTCIDDTCIGKDGRFSDRYFTGLSEYLKSSGKRVSTLIWIYNTGKKNVFSVFRWFKQSKESFLLPQDYYNLLDCAYAFFIVLKTAMLRFSQKDLFYQDLDFSPLIKHEQLLQARETGSAYFINRIKMFKKFKDSGLFLDTYIDFWETRNTEAASLLGIKKYYPNCKTFSFQHGALMAKLLFCSYKTTPEEFNASVHADVGVVNSKIVKEFMLKNGFPGSFINVGPALRYMWIRNYLDLADGDKKNEVKQGVLVCLSLSYDISSEIMELLHKAFLNKAGYQILVRPHPMMNFDKLKRRLSFSWPQNFALAEGSIEMCLKRAKVVITSQSSTMVEAASLMAKVIIIARETDIDIIPLDILDNSKEWVIVRTAGDLLNEVEKALHQRGRVDDHVKNDYFEFNMEVLNKILNSSR